MLFDSDFLNGFSLAACIFIAIGLYLYLLISDKGDGK